MSAPNLQASKWAPRSSNPIYTTPHLSTSTITNNTTYAPPQINNQTTRSRSLSPSKRQPQPQPRSQPKPPSKASLDLQTRQSSHKNFTQLFRRLKWKSTNLLFSFQRVFRCIALETNPLSSSNHQHDRSIQGLHTLDQLDHALNLNPLSSLEAETMFKIDFFEFYVLLERTLVCLLGVWGVLVSGSYARDVNSIDSDGNRTLLPFHPHNIANGDLKPKSTILGDSHGGFKHRFHANVLAALDTDNTPLHSILGTGAVRDYLGIAKEFRNRWKDVDERGKSEVDDGLVGSRYERLLRELRLEAMLVGILEGVERCDVLAGEEVRRIEGLGNGEGKEVVMGMERGVDMEVDFEGSPWEAVDDAMEMD